jgi:hypothetical protein
VPGKRVVFPVDPLEMLRQQAVWAVLGQHDGIDGYLL